MNGNPSNHKAKAAPQKIATSKPASLASSTYIPKDWRYLFFLSLVFLFSFSYIFDVKLDLNGDNFGYLNYAKAIADGKGYVSPYSSNFPPTNWFPPGYAALLASLMLVFGEKIVLFKVVNGLMYFGAMLLLFDFGKRLTNNKPLAFTIVTLLFLNSGLMRYATILMSEIPYLFFSVLAFYMLISMEKKPNFLKNSRFWWLVLASAAAFYFRSVGLALVAAVACYFLFEKRWKEAAVYVSGFVLLYLPWAIRDHVHGLKGRYLDTMTVANAWRPEEGKIDSISGFLDKMQLNFFDTVIKGFSEVTFPFIQIEEKAPGTMWVIGLLVLAFVFYGVWKTGKYKILFGTYILANIGVFLLWHSGNGSRYVWPLSPFITFCFYLGVFQLLVLLLGKLKVPIKNGVGYAFLLVAFMLFPKMQELNAMAKADYWPAYKNYFEMAKAVKKYGQPTNMVCCRKAEMFHYFSGTYVTMYEFSLDDKQVIQKMLDNKVDYVILEQLGYSSTARYLYPAIMKHQDMFKVVMQLPNPDTYLLYFDKAAASSFLALPAK